VSAFGSAPATPNTWVDSPTRCVTANRCIWSVRRWYRTSSGLTPRVPARSRSGIPGRSSTTFQHPQLELVQPPAVLGHGHAGGVAEFAGTAVLALHQLLPLQHVEVVREGPGGQLQVLLDVRVGVPRMHEDVPADHPARLLVRITLTIPVVRSRLPEATDPLPVRGSPRCRNPRRILRTIPGMTARWTSDRQAHHT